MRLKLKIYLEDDGRLIFGPGRAKLLRSVESLGSLRQAALSLGMSYRWAWGKLTESSKSLELPLLEKTSKKVGASKALTTEAQAILAWYSELEQELDKTLALMVQKKPPCLKKLE